MRKIKTFSFDIESKENANMKTHLFSIAKFPECRDNKKQNMIVVCVSVYTFSDLAETYL